MKRKNIDKQEFHESPLSEDIGPKEVGYQSEGSGL